MDELKNTIMKTYGQSAGKIENFMDGYLLYIGEKKKYLGRYNVSPGRLLFIHGVKEHLADRGFENTDRFIPSIQGEPFMLFQDELYAMTDWNTGRECDFFRMEDIVKAIGELANMHLASAGYTAPDGSVTKNALGKAPGSYRKKIRELNKIKGYAGRGRTDFDRLYMGMVDRLYPLAESAARRIDGKAYRTVVEKAKNKRFVCHGDLSHRNIVFGKKGIHIRGFGYCRYETRVSDVVDIIRRRLRKCQWSADEAAVLVNEYARLASLDSDELEVIKGMLQFPYRFWRLSNRFYNSKRSWAVKTYTPKMKELARDVDRILCFANSLDSAF